MPSTLAIDIVILPKRKRKYIINKEGWIFNEQL